METFEERQRRHAAAAGPSSKSSSPSKHNSKSRPSRRKSPPSRQPAASPSPPAKSLTLKAIYGGGKEKQQQGADEKKSTSSSPTSKKKDPVGRNKAGKPKRKNLILEDISYMADVKIPSGKEDRVRHILQFAILRLCGRCKTPKKVKSRKEMHLVLTLRQPLTATGIILQLLGRSRPCTNPETALTFIASNPLNN